MATSHLKVRVAGALRSKLRHDRLTTANPVVERHMTGRLSALRTRRGIGNRCAAP
ncbi:hypothetical protein [Piscinibacter koreensis]|uniref:Uncharacterized protein n=1 Tax=Piscinibacter koreensis TaxID=2742824 RepID=A0A7Y6TVQ6_9BURK|nr:hypothetical protein [Schlegelella koreensis]NUZ05177.1 hypothetical protein [Schlegelella koreensis]